MNLCAHSALVVFYLPLPTMPGQMSTPINPNTKKIRMIKKLILSLHPILRRIDSYFNRFNTNTLKILFQYKKV